MKKWDEGDYYKEKDILVKASSCVQVRKTERIVIFGRLKHKTQSRVRGLEGPVAPYRLEARSGGGCPWSEKDLAALGQGEQQSQRQP